MSLCRVLLCACELKTAQTSCSLGSSHLDFFVEYPEFEGPHEDHKVQVLLFPGVYYYFIFFLGNYFASHFFMGGEKFDTPHPEGYLFGENMDLNFLGNRPVQASSCILSMLHFSAQKASSSDFPVGTWRYFGAHRCLMRLEKAACSSDSLVLWEQAVALS